MLFLILLISFFNLHAMNLDTTIAPRKTITAAELIATNAGIMHCQNHKTLPRKFVLELENACVYEDGHIITSDHFLLEDTVIKYPEKPLSEYHMLHRTELPHAHHFNGRLAIIASPGSQCYYHWMFQILPRLKILKDLALEYDALYLEPLNYSFQLETLAKIGINDKRIVFAKPNSQTSAATLIIPSIVIKEPCLKFPTWVIDFLRSEFLEISNIEKFKDFKKIYISRSKAATRRIVNEKELVEFLTQQGFSTIHMEDYSLMEQAALIYNADVIISPHGSGLSNLVFAHKETHVVEIFNHDGFTTLFYHLAEAVGLSHHAIVCSDEKLSAEQQSKEDMLVDIYELESILNSIKEK